MSNYVDSSRIEFKESTQQFHHELLCRVRLVEENTHGWQTIATGVTDAVATDFSRFCRDYRGHKSVGRIKELIYYCIAFKVECLTHRA